MENNVQGRMSVGKGLELFKKKSLKNEEEEEEEINISVKDLSLMGREIDQKLDESKKLDRLENSFGDELNESDVQVVDIEKTFKSENEEEEEKEEKMEEELEKKVIQSFVDSQQNIKKTESPQNQSQKKIILKKISSDEEEGKEIASKSEKSSEEDEEDDDGHPNPYKGQKKSEKHNPWEKALEEESLGTLDFGKGFSPNKDIVKEEQEEKGKSNFFDEKISPIDKKRKKQFFMKKGSVEDDNDSKKSFRKRDGSAFVVTGDHKFVDTPDKKIEVRKKKKRSRSARINSHAKNRRVGAAIKIVSNPVEILQKEEENKTEKEEDREVEDELNSHDITDWNPPEINELKRHTPTPGFDNFGKSSVIEIMNDFGQNENEEGTEFDKPDLRKQFSPTIDLYESMPVEDQVQNGEEEEVKGEDNEKDKFILEPDFERGFSFKDKKLIARDVEEMKKQPKSVIMENENEDNEPKSEKKLVDEKEGIEEEKQTVEEGEEKVKQAVEEEEEKQIEFEVENKEPLEEEENKEIPEKEKEISVENKWGEENEDDKDNNPFFNAFGKTKNEEKEAAFPELSVSLEKFADIETMKEVSPSSDFGNFDNFKQPFNQSTDMVKVDTDLVEEGDPFRDVFGKKSHENIVQSEEKKPFGFDEKDDDEEEEKEFESAIDNADSDIDTNFDQFNFKSNEERSPDAFNKKKNQEKIEEVIEENKPEEKEEEFNKEKESEEKEVENKGQVKENKEQEIVKTETPDNKEQEEPEPTPTDIKKIPIEPEQKKTQNPAKEIPIQPKPDKTFSKNPTQISSASELPSEYQATPTIKKREQFDLSLHKTTSLMEEARENQNRIIEESPEIIEEGSSSDIFKGFENKNESEIDWGNNFENKGDDEWGNGWGNENGDDYWNHKNQSVELEPLELSESNFGSNERNPFADI